MCGIAGLVSRERERGRERLAAALKSIAHRGPDSEGQAEMDCGERAVMFGHRRLSIIDTSLAGTQPMRLPDGSAIIFNGEIYNYAELKKELAARGVAFESNSDTEALLHGLKHFGAAYLDRLEGIFAFAYFDAEKRELLLARDAVGVKPLYVSAYHPAYFAFASEVRAMHHLGAAGGVDREALAGYLRWGYVREPRTIHDGVSMLPPGHYLRIDLAAGKADRPMRFFRPVAESEAEADTPVHLERSALIRTEVERAVVSNLLSDVPIGAFLSGGVDSSIVVACAAKAKQRLVTVSLTFGENEEKSEAPYAREVAKRYGTDHREILVSADRFLVDTLDRFLDAMDQPTFDGVNSFVVSEAARRAGLTVVLSGTGGDELFGGYPSFKDVPAARKRASLLGPLSAAAGHALQSAVPFGRAAKIGDMLEAGTRGWADLYRARKSLFSAAACGKLMRGWQEAPALPPDLAGEDIEKLDGFNAVSTLEVGIYLRDCLLRDIDVFSMAHALEARVPLLEKRLVEAAFGLSGAAKAPTSEMPVKAALIDAFRDAIPEGCWRRPKQGFSFPFAKWLCGPLKQRVEEDLFGANPPLAPHLDMRVVADLWQAFQADPQKVGPSRPWALFVLSHWLKGVA